MPLSTEPIAVKLNTNGTNDENKSDKNTIKMVKRDVSLKSNESKVDKNEHKHGHQHSWTEEVEKQMDQGETNDMHTASANRYYLNYDPYAPYAMLNLHPEYQNPNQGVYSNFIEYRFH